MGFVGAPWTIATYIVEGGTTRTYTTIKSMCHTAPNLLRTLLSHLTKAIADYIIYQVESGAHCIQIFDSWGGQLPPHMWELWSKPYIVEVTCTLLVGSFFHMKKIEGLLVTFAAKMKAFIYSFKLLTDCSQQIEVL